MRRSPGGILGLIFRSTNTYNVTRYGLCFPPRINHSLMGFNTSQTPPHLTVLHAEMPVPTSMLMLAFAFLSEWEGGPPLLFHYPMNWEVWKLPSKYVSQKKKKLDFAIKCLCDLRPFIPLLHALVSIPWWETWAKWFLNSPSSVSTSLCFLHQLSSLCTDSVSKIFKQRQLWGAQTSCFLGIRLKNSQTWKDH